MKQKTIFRKFIFLMETSIPAGLSNLNTKIEHNWFPDISMGNVSCLLEKNSLIAYFKRKQLGFRFQKFNEMMLF